MDSAVYLGWIKSSQRGKTRGDQDSCGNFKVSYSNNCRETEGRKKESI